MVIWMIKRTLRGMWWRIRLIAALEMVITAVTAAAMIKAVASVLVTANAGHSPRS